MGVKISDSNLHRKGRNNNSRGRQPTDMSEYYNRSGTLKGSNKRCGTPSGSRSFLNSSFYRGLAPTAIIVSSLQDEDRLISK
jgi:hypothetical protein